MFRTHQLIGGGLALAMMLVFAPVPLWAQWSPASKHPYLRYGYNPGYYAGAQLPIPPAARGYQMTRMIQQQQIVSNRIAVATASAPSYTTAPAETAAPTSLAVGINPSPERPVVAIRGPDGQVRHFPVASPDAIQPRTIIVRPGEKLSITINGAMRVQVQPQK